MKYCWAILACAGVIAIYTAIGITLGWRHGGGILSMAILCASLAATWKAIMKWKGRSSPAVEFSDGASARQNTDISEQDVPPQDEVSCERPENDAPSASAPADPRTRLPRVLRFTMAFFAGAVTLLSLFCAVTADRFDGQFLGGLSMGAVSGTLTFLLLRSAKKPGRKRSPRSVLAILTAVALVIGAGRFPYEYYVMLHIVVTAMATLGTIRCLRQRRDVGTAVFLAIILVFNPLYWPPLREEAWGVIDICAAVAFIAYSRTIAIRPKQPDQLQIVVTSK